MTTLSQVDGASTALTFPASYTWSPQTVVMSAALALSTAGTSGGYPDDVQLTFSAAVPAGTISDQGAINVWIAINESGGASSYTDADLYTSTVAGSGGTLASLRSPNNLYGPFVIYCVANVTSVGVLSSLATILNGVLPRSAGFALENRTGLTLTAAAGSYTAVNYTNL
jgi:hypothetical protein